MTHVICLEMHITECDCGLRNRRTDEQWSKANDFSDKTEVNRVLNQDVDDV